MQFVERVDWSEEEGEKERKGGKREYKQCVAIRCLSREREKGKREEGGGIYDVW